MRTILFVFLVAVFTLGCSPDQEASIYDTKTNPLNFPQEAIKLLDDVVSERLVTLDEISEAFANLYTGNSSLLDNEPWRDIIDQLGVWLGTKANELVEQRLKGYVRAADYFALASFARPDDEALAEMRSVFTPLMMLAPSLPEPSVWENLPLKGRINILRRFYGYGNEGRLFADNYLKETLISNSGLSGSNLSLPDQAFLAVAGLAGFVPDTTLLSFEDPRLDLVAINFDPIEANVYQANLYFIVKETPQSDLTVALRLFALDSTGKPDGAGQIAPFDFDPAPSSSTWQPGSMAMTSRTIHFSGRIEDIVLGLIDRTVTPSKYISAIGLDSQLYRLRATADLSE